LAGDLEVQKTRMKKDRFEIRGGGGREQKGEEEAKSISAYEERTPQRYWLRKSEIQKCPEKGFLGPWKNWRGSAYGEKPEGIKSTSWSLYHSLKFRGLKGEEILRKKRRFKTRQVPLNSWQTPKFRKRYTIKGRTWAPRPSCSSGNPKSGGEKNHKLLNRLP